MIIDDHQMIREGLIVMLSSCEEIEISCACESGQTAKNMFSSNNTDVVLLDSKMKASDGIGCTKQIQKLRPGTKTIFLTVIDDVRFVCKALHAGVDGYILKYVSKEKLIDSIKRVHLGEKIIDNSLMDAIIDDYAKLTRTKPVDEAKDKTIQFTSREREIFYYLSKGMTNKELSAVTHSSVDTVKTHLRNIFRKLEVNNRSQAINQGSKYFEPFEHFNFSKEKSYNS
jgi:DNA-binding NarL/FixJ family response regulator